MPKIANYGLKIAVVIKIICCFFNLYVRFATKSKNYFFEKIISFKGCHCKEFGNMIMVLSGSYNMHNRHFSRIYLEQMKSKSFGIVKLLLLCFLVAVVASVPTLVVANKNRKMMENETINSSAFQGVLTIWNVDTFESGSQSKSVMVERVAENFSKSNKGVYFLVKNLSVEELVQNLITGTSPDIITFGFGIGELVKPILTDLNGVDVGTAREEVVRSGQINDTQYAVGFLMGGYILASTEEKLRDASISGAGLEDVLNSAGFDVSTKSEQKHICSTVVGKNDYILPCESVQTLTGKPLTDVYASTSMYDAYADFVNYNAGTILIGTHRDLYKLSGRVAVGKITGVKIEYLSGFTNLIHYAGVVKQESAERVGVAKEFVASLLTPKNQAISTAIGMVNVLGEKFYKQSDFVTLEENLNKPIAIPSLFNNV